MERKKSKVGAGIVAAIVLLMGVGLAVYALTMQPVQETESTSSSSDADKSADTNDSDSTVDPDTPVSSDVATETIVFTDDGFSKSSYTVKAGQEVTVENDSSMDVQFSSADHPTHTEEPALNMATLAAGESGTFTAPAEPGSYGFHDHINDQFTGTLVVE